MRWQHARCLSQWAQAHLARGGAADRQRAQALLRQAAAELDAMDAPAYAALIRANLEDPAPPAGL